MNRLQRYFLPLALGAFLFAACEAPNDNVASGDVAYGGKPGGATTPAAPAIAFTSSTTVSKQVRNTLCVKDSDGTHAANIVVAPDAFTLYNRPTWSPDGTKLAYIEMAGGGVYRLKTTVVTVSNGVAVAGTTTTLLSIAATDSVALYGASWSLGSNDEIVYTLKSIKASETNTQRMTRMYVISSSGGASTEIYSKQGIEIQLTTWSPDGSKIAFSERTLLNDAPPIDIADTLKIIDRSTLQVTNYVTGTLNDRVTEIEWSRAGLNKIAYVRQVINGGTTYSIHLLDLSQSPAATSLLLTGGRWPTWSPTNYKIAYEGIGTGQCSTIVVSTGTTALLNSGGSRQNWKK